MNALQRNVARPQPRDDLKVLQGYHSPQLDVSVRLNTNESPFAVPQSFLDEYSQAIANLDFHRYPDRGATELRAALGTTLHHDPQRIFCANGSNEVLQTLLLTYGGPSRRALVSLFGAAGITLHTRARSSRGCSPRANAIPR